MLENHKVFTTMIGGKEVSVDVGKYAQQANGSCIVRCGETVVMVNVTMAPVPREGMDFFPLSVDYEEKMYSVGKIPSSSLNTLTGFISLMNIVHKSCFRRCLIITMINLRDFI